MKLLFYNLPLAYINLKIDDKVRVQVLVMCTNLYMVIEVVGSASIYVCLLYQKTFTDLLKYGLTIFIR